MDNTNANSRRERDGGGEQDISPQVQGHVPPQVQEQVLHHVSNDPPIGNALFDKFRGFMNMLTQVLMAQDNGGELAPSNSIQGMGATIVRELLRISPPDFYGSKFEEDPNGFIAEV